MTGLELFELFTDETSGWDWFEAMRWAEGRYCGHCGSEHTNPVKNEKAMPYRYTDCRKYFNIKTGTLIHWSTLLFGNG